MQLVIIIIFGYMGGGRGGNRRGGCGSTHDRDIRPQLGTLLAFVAIAIPLLPLAECGRTCRRLPVIFNFGDSNSDTGGLSAGLGYNFGLPEGRAFFHTGTGRLCDGRLIIDFFCESVNSSYLSPYLESLTPNFTHGANFAIAGATLLPRGRPFSLNIQTLQFVRFQNKVLELVARGARGLIDHEGFRHALYSFDIGQNDLTGCFYQNMSYQRILEAIPDYMAEIKGSIQNIYGHGGRNFWVHNTGPLGCSPEKLAIYNKDGKDLDAVGCITTINNAAKAFNAGLEALCDELRSQLAGATVVYTDVYGIKYDIISNHTKHGFENPLMACCGHGGAPYNYDPHIHCLSPGFQVCNEGSRRISWDGVHYTEAANSIVASRILSGDHSKPRVKFDYFCST